MKPRSLQSSSFGFSFLSSLNHNNKENEALSVILARTGIIPVISITDLESAVPLAKALYQGGIRTIEIALRTPVAYEAIKRIKANCPDLIVGAATVMTTKEMSAAIKSGANFCASPMFDTEIMKFAAANKIHYLPCVSNLSEINLAAKLGFKTQKLFPMESLDTEQGEKFLRGTKTMATKLQVKFCTSCLETSKSDIERYLKHKHVIAIASGWSTPSDLVEKKDWLGITERVSEDLAQAKKIITNKIETVVPFTIFSNAQPLILDHATSTSVRKKPSPLARL